MPPVIRNPVLPGSHPDPSIVRVGADFVVATSTFEWSPGVRLHGSRDLRTWTDLGGVLDSTRLLDLTGVPDSGGVWAPNLSHVDGLFHLVYSNVSAYTDGFADAPNYLTTAASIDGPWSDPVLLHARGFDASLFHDGPDSWLLNLVHDWRPGHGGSAGLEVTRFDRATRTLVGEPAFVELPADGTWIEGPNLYRRGDWYYLVTADGGTGYEHQVRVARSRTLTGPYVRDPHGPLITARDHPDLPLQKAGHGSLVQTEAGDWYLAYLVARPHGRHGPCILGRETALAVVTWTDDGWPRTATGLPEIEVPALLDDAPPPDGPAGRLGPEWSTLRRPATDDWLTVDGDRITLRGGRSPQSLVGPSLLAQRITAPRCSFEATVDYRPRAFQHLAGITTYYNSRNWMFLHVTTNDVGDPFLRLAVCDHGVVTNHEDRSEKLYGPVLTLGLDLDGPDIRFRRDTGDGWNRFSPTLDATILSDEHAVELHDGRPRAMGFTGAFVGLWAWDLTGAGHPATFTKVSYQPAQVE
ncbi:family 43 glycosylhydrolase [Cellulomonas sp.]|uniref:family 43 glycosylhydrolase n=1 Tax=Cellulomonas sp. TaxID=40001 RepID=UPI003BAB15E1